MPGKTTPAPSGRKKGIPEGVIPLTERSPEEAWKIRSMGGKASKRKQKAKREMAELIEMIMESGPVVSDQAKAMMKSLGLDPNERVTLRMLAVLRAAKKASEGDLKSLQLLYDMECYERRDKREEVRFQQQLELDRKRYDLEYQKFHQNDVDNNMITIQGNLQGIAELLRAPVKTRTIEDIETATEEDMKKEEDDVEARQKAREAQGKKRRGRPKKKSTETKKESE